MKKIMVPGITLAILTILFLGMSPAETVPDVSPTSPLRAIRTAPITETEITQDVQLSGVTRGEKNAMVSFTLGGRLETRSLDIGDQISRGDVLAELGTKPFRHALDAARKKLTELETRLAQSERDLVRSQKLFDMDAATREELEKIMTQKDALAVSREALLVEITESERRLTETTLRSPINGLITDVFLEPSEFARPGLPIYSISSRDVEVELELPETMAADLAIGQEVLVQFPLADHEPVSGSVTYLGESTSGPGRLFPVIIRLDQSTGVLPGLTAEVTIKRKFGNSMIVPLQAIIDPGGRNAHIFKVQDGIAQKTRVKIVRFMDDQVLAVGELNDKDVVVIEGHHQLIDGDEVQILATAEAKR